MFLDAATMQINRSDFELVPEVRRPGTGCAVNISPSGQVSLNKPLIEQIRQKTGALKLGFACRREDKRVLLLFETDTPNYGFPASGSRKDVRLTRSLVESGITLPARYAVSWNPGASAWVGVLCGEPTEDALAGSLKAGRRKK